MPGIPPNPQGATERRRNTPESQAHPSAPAHSCRALSHDNLRQDATGRDTTRQKGKMHADTSEKGGIPDNHLEEVRWLSGGRKSTRGA